jgi:hypothetical protein
MTGHRIATRARRTTPHMARVQLDGEPFPALDQVKVTTRAECTASASDHRGAEVLDVGEPTVDIDQLVVHERVHCIELIWPRGRDPEDHGFRQLDLHRLARRPGNLRSSADQPTPQARPAVVSR